MRNFKIFLSLLTLCLFLFSSCNTDDATVTDNTPLPELPPESSMVINFDLQSQKSSRIARTDSTGTKWNAGVSGLVVWFWSGVVKVTLAIPVVSFQNSFAATPVKTGIGQRTWSQEYNHFGGKIISRLVGTVNGNSVNWEMYIQKTGFGAFNEVLWFSGESSLDGSGGSWVLNKDKDNVTAFLGIEWTKNETTGIATAKYTLKQNTLNNGKDNEGSYLYYEKNGNSPFNTKFEGYGADEMKTTTIEWHDVNKVGKLMQIQSINGSDSTLYDGCWDESYIDKSCD